jgi:hypothetical protein
MANGTVVPNIKMNAGNSHPAMPGLLLDGSIFESQGGRSGKNRSLIKSIKRMRMPFTISIE